MAKKKSYPSKNGKGSGNKKKAPSKKSTPKKESAAKKTVMAPYSQNSEAKWQSEQDANTLAEAQEIRGNRARLKRAKSEARRRISRMKKVVGK